MKLAKGRVVDGKEGVPLNLFEPKGKLEAWDALQGTWVYSVLMRGLQAA